jgi:hypothetical protein
MAFIGDKYWYVDGGDFSTTGYFATPKWQANHTYVCGDKVRPDPALTPISSGNERIYVCVSSTGGTGQSAGTSPPFNGGAVIARGAKTTDNTVIWQECTGSPAMNGDSVNAPNWTAVKNLAVSLGLIIQNNARNLTLSCTTAGTTSNGAEPSWPAFTNAGATLTDGSAVWTVIINGVSSGWAAPFAREFTPNQAAVNWGANGHVFFVASEHQDVTSLFTGSSLGTPGQPCYVVCVNKLNVPPTAANVTSGAVIGGGSGTLVIGSTTAGHLFYKGITFQNVGNSPLQFKNGVASYFRFDSCTFDKSGDANAGGLITFNAGSAAALANYDFNGCVVKFGHISQGITVSSLGGAGVVRFMGGSMALTGTVPTKLILGNPNIMLLERVDLSGVNTKLFAAITGRAMVKGCKTNASMTVADAQTAASACIDFIRSDSANTYRGERHTSQGDLTTETTIVRTGGAAEGGQAYSWKIITSANTNWILPFECLPLLGRNTIAGTPVTVTVFGIWGSGVVPNNDDVWIDVVYPGDSGDPLELLATTTKSEFLATGTATSTDSSTWGGSTTPFKMSATFTPQKAGPFYIVVKLGKASTTFYVDTKYLQT